tara:strand:+ start:1380 stop:2489 length:1110 start_codon:yes stop_codon:yes gene_type:complete
MTDNVDKDLLNLRTGIDALYKAVESITTRQPAAPYVAPRSLTGDQIMGGTISNFSSIGIKDAATKLVVLVNDKGLHVDNINVKTLLGDTQVGGSLFVTGDITARKLHVDELTADVRLERSTPLEFTGDEKGVYGKGLLWRHTDNTKSFVFRANPDRIWSSESIDLNTDAAYMIGNTTVLRQTELGGSVRTSNLVKVGTLQNLKTSGDLQIDEYMYYESASQRLGLGTESPNGSLSIASLDSELIFDVDSKSRIGNYTTSDLEIITDDTARITISATGNITLGTSVETKISVIGKLGVNVKNPDCDIVTAGPVKFQGKKQEVGHSIPSNGSYKLGDLVWNDTPRPTGYIGWVCVREGTPGEWKPFGQISS